MKYYEEHWRRHRRHMMKFTYWYHLVLGLCFILTVGCCLFSCLWGLVT